jgi:hypothetical protein
MVNSKNQKMFDTSKEVGILLLPLEQFLAAFRSLPGQGTSLKVCP